MASRLRGRPWNQRQPAVWARDNSPSARPTAVKVPRQNTLAAEQGATTTKSTKNTKADFNRRLQQEVTEATENTGASSLFPQLPSVQIPPAAFVCLVCFVVHWFPLFHGSWEPAAKVAHRFEPGVAANAQPLKNRTEMPRDRAALALPQLMVKRLSRQGVRPTQEGHVISAD